MISLSVSVGATFGCSKSSDSSSPAIGITSSCTFSEGDQCAEYYVASAYSGEQNSLQAEGSWSATTACRASGKLKGCQLTVNGVKTLTTWAYNAEGQAFIEAACSQYPTTGGMVATLVTP